MIWIATNGTTWWALEHEGDYSDEDRLFKVELSRFTAVVTEVPNKSK